MLSKPVNKNESKSPFIADKLIVKPATKNAKVAEPTPEQIKWDIEDQSFIKKEFVNDDRKI